MIDWRCWYCGGANSYDDWRCRWCNAPVKMHHYTMQSLDSYASKLGISSMPYSLKGRILDGGVVTRKPTTYFY